MGVRYVVWGWSNEFTHLARGGREGKWYGALLKFWVNRFGLAGRSGEGGMRQMLSVALHSVLPATGGGSRAFLSLGVERNKEKTKE